jgi:O-antigen/teichoic acid export membrane protein
MTIISLKSLTSIKIFLRSERFRRLSKEGFWIILGQTAVVVGTLVGVRLLTGLMDPETYGELALGMTIATLVNQVMIGPISNGITRFYAPSQEQGDIGSYLNAVRRLVLLATCVIIMMILFVVVGLLIIGQTKWIAIATASFIFAIFSGYNLILNGIQNAARQRSIVALHQGMESWLRYLVAVGLMLWLGATSSVTMIGYAIAAILVLGSQYLFFSRIVPTGVIEADKVRNWQIQIWKYSWPFTSWGIFYWAQSASDRWALKFFSTTQDVGLYAVLFQLGYYPVSIATGMAVQLLAPIFYQRSGDGRDRRRNTEVSKLSWHLTEFSIGVTFIAFIVAFLFHTQIFRILVAREYLSISYLLPWMFLAGGLFAAGQTISLDLMSQLKTNKMTMAKITTALLGVLLNCIGAYWYGIKGIVIASIFFSVLYFVWIAMLSIRIAAKSRI